MTQFMAEHVEHLQRVARHGPILDSGSSGSPDGSLPKKRRKKENDGTGSDEVMQDAEKEGDDGEAVAKEGPDEWEAVIPFADPVDGGDEAAGETGGKGEMANLEKDILGLPNEPKRGGSNGAGPSDGRMS